MTQNLQKPSVSTKTATRTEAYLDDIRLENLQSNLPDNVFLLSISAATARSTMRDQTLTVEGKRVHPSNDYPYEWIVPGKTPVMNQQSAYFTNPAEDPPKRKSPWSFDGFFNRYSEMMDLVRSHTSSVVDRTYIKGITVVEVHDENFCSIGPMGRKKWDWNAMSKNNAEMGIARFEMRQQGFENDVVKERLSSSLAGDTKKPIKLVETKLVSAKSPEHDDRSKKKHYYTSEDWKKNICPSIGLAPDIVDLNETTLGNATSKNGKEAVSKFVPELVNQGFVKISKLTGEVESNQDFRANDVRFL